MSYAMSLSIRLSISSEESSQKFTQAASKRKLCGLIFGFIWLSESCSTRSRRPSTTRRWWTARTSHEFLRRAVQVRRRSCRIWSTRACFLLLVGVRLTITLHTSAAATRPVALRTTITYYSGVFPTESRVEAYSLYRPTILVTDLPVIGM